MRSLLSSLLLLTLFACSTPQTPEQQEKSPQPIQNPTNQVQLSSEIEWEQLNPARGDQSPQAGTVWGDRKGTVPTGFLAKFVDGFSSPPHIHNVTYRAVVLKGAIHNDDPAAENMWMQPGSFWTQPKGEAHITSARGEECIAYVEIDNGPYLVKPTAEAFDSGERPVNVDAANVVWLNSHRTNWVAPECMAEVSFLWDTPQNGGLQGLFIKLPAGFQGVIHSDGDIFHAVMILGKIAYTLPQTGAVKELDPGSYFRSTDRARHELFNETTGEAIVYIRTNGKLEVSESK